MASNVFSTYRNGLHFDDPQYLKIGVFGNLVKEDTFIDEISPYCEDVVKIESFDLIEEIVKIEGLQMIFGFTEYSQVLAKKFQESRIECPDVVIGFGIKHDDVAILSDILALECERYFVQSDDIGG